MTTTFNPADKSAGITLSNGNLTAKNTTNTLQGVRALDKQTFGKFYFEATFDTFLNLNDAVGVGNASAPLTTAFSSGALAGVGVVGVMQNSNGGVYYDGGYKFQLGGISAGSTLAIAVDLTGQQAWFKLMGSAGLWDSNITDNPATPTGGANCAAVTTVDAVPMVAVWSAGDAVTANFGSTPFASPAPTGFVGWPKTGGGFTTWSTTDLSGCTLSNGNLTATATAGGYVKAADKQLPAGGKFYWEITVTKLSGNGGIGFCPTANVAPAYNNQTCFHINSSGSLYMNGSIVLSSLVPITAGCTLGIAVDLTTNKVWFRNKLASLWNGSATADPATGVGGLAVPTVGQPYVVAPLVELQATNDQVTANFGAGAFVGAVPAGFTAGWSSGGVSTGTSAMVSQVAIEEWIRNLGTNAIITQVALEEWATVATLPPGGGAKAAQAMVMA